MLVEAEQVPARITAIVTQYLLGQGWQLVDPTVLAAKVWPAAQGKGLAETAAPDEIQTLTWLEYAPLLYEACHRPREEAAYQQAWRELGVWLSRNAHQVTSHPQEQEEVVQETLLELQQRWQQKGLRAPRTLWAYALQTLRNKQTDLHRKRSAKKRGEDKILSLETVLTDEDAVESRWEEKLPGGVGTLDPLPSAGHTERSTENQMATAEIRTQLQKFFRQHLPTALQQQVAVAIFLDGLAPKEVAGLLGKKPHEIRLLKARIVKRLRNLPEAQRQELLQILGEDEEGDGHE